MIPNVVNWTVESYGAWGCEAQNTFSRLATRLAIKMLLTKSPGTIKFVLQNEHHTGQIKCKGFVRQDYTRVS